MASQTELIESVQLKAAAANHGTQAAIKLPRIFCVEGQNISPAYLKCAPELEDRSLLYCAHGTGQLFIGDANAQFIGPGTAMIIGPREPWTLLLGRGEQSWLLATWSPDNPAIPNSDRIAKGACLVTSCSPVVRMLTDRVVARKDDLAEWPNFVLAWFNLLFHEWHVTRNVFSLTPTFMQGAEPLDDLIAAIRAEPQRQWNLTNAAELAGYSPFHLSRIFRQISKMGFPEFVDRCRAEIAVDLLINTSQPSARFPTSADLVHPKP
ncbi:MAG: helix-turn-helix transcriptional regulator [Armatimonadetes bacterium]|nr:helix-turn-helix transcriptional regulator [Armatimonadota bacterium]MBX3109893.1 helix-turn-helix transcriptional regulator [Fimbriimonadaceae bacterium]